MAVFQPALNSFGMFTDHTQRLRRNLLVVAGLSIAFAAFGIRIEPSATLEGITVTGLTTIAVKTLFFGTVAYNLVAYLWHAIDEIRGWDLAKLPNIWASFARDIGPYLDVSKIYDTTHPELHDRQRAIEQIRLMTETTKILMLKYRRSVYWRVWGWEFGLAAGLGFLALASLIWPQPVIVVAKVFPLIF